MSEIQSKYVVCVSGKGDELSVLKGKLYREIEPEPNDGEKHIRVIDETGEDYLYSRDWFEPVELSPRVIEALDPSAEAA